MSTDDRLDALTASARDLKASVDDLARRQRSNRISIAITMLLLFGMGAVLIGQIDTNDRVRKSLAQDYVTAQQQAQTRVKVLCPLYTLLLAVASDPVRLAALPASQRARADVAIQVIRGGYTALGCKPDPS